MGNIQQVIDVVEELPSKEYIKIAHMLAKHDILGSMEKTASVSTKLVEREQEILDAFYKQAGLLSGATAVGKGLYGAAKAGISGMRSAPGRQMIASGTKATTGQIARAGGQAAKKSFVNSPGMAALRQGGQNVAQFGGQVAARTAPARQQMSQAYQQGKVQGSRLMKTNEYDPTSFIGAGVKLAQAINLNIDLEKVAEPLEKLAVIGSVNHKLQAALTEPSLTKEARDYAYKLGRENNAHCIETLKELTKTAGPYGTRGLGNKLSGTMNTQAGQAASTSLKNAFGGGSKSKSSGGSFLSNLFGGSNASKSLTTGAKSFGTAAKGTTASTGSSGTSASSTL